MHSTRCRGRLPFGESFAREEAPAVAAALDDIASPDLLDLLNGTGALVELESQQVASLGEIVDGTTLMVNELTEAVALPFPSDKQKIKIAATTSNQMTLD